MLGAGFNWGPPPLDVIAQWHPQFALAAAEGVPVRPNNRILEFPFSTNAVETRVPANFDQQISIYSIFAGFEYTIDPSGAFADSSLKGQSDFYTEQVSGLLFNFVVRGGGDEYSPIPVDVPLQLVRRVLNPSVGVWSMWNAQNVFGYVTVNSPPIGDTFTVWAVFGFYVLGAEGARYLCYPAHQARRLLRERHGILCQCGPSTPIPGAPPASVLGQPLPPPEAQGGP
jgi:hypothetical protein